MIEDEIRVHYRSIGKTLRRRRQSSCRQDCSQEMGLHPTGHLGLPIGLRRTWDMWRDRVVSQFGPTIGSPGSSSQFWSHSSFREECSFSRGEIRRKHPRLWPGKIKNTWLEHLWHPWPWAMMGNDVLGLGTFYGLWSQEKLYIHTLKLTGQGLLSSSKRSTGNPQSLKSTYQVQSCSAQHSGCLFLQILVPLNNPQISMFFTVLQNQCFTSLLDMCFKKMFMDEIRHILGKNVWKIYLIRH